MKVMLIGKPRTGKTTLVRKLVEIFEEEKIGGFITEEVLENGRRTGFELVDLRTGKRQILARKGIQGNPKVGSYVVDVDGFDSFLKELDISESRIVFIDEVGKMECLSEDFRKFVEELAVQPVPVVFTLPERGSQFIESFKKKHDFFRLILTQQNRERILKELTQLLGSALNRM